MKKIKAIIRILLTPSCWLRNYSTNKFLSVRINNAIDREADVILHDNYRVIMDGMLIWIENYPYAFGQVSGQRGMPDRTTVFRLVDYIDSKLAYKDKKQ